MLSPSRSAEALPILSEEVVDFVEFIDKAVAFASPASRPEQRKPIFVGQVDEFTVFTEKQTAARTGVPISGEKQRTEQPVFTAQVDEFTAFVERRSLAEPATNKDAG